MLKHRTLKSSLPVLDIKHVPVMQADGWRTSDQMAALRCYGYTWQQFEEVGA